MMPDNRNFILAIGLSLAVLVGWTYFVSGPQLERAREEQALIEAQQQAEAAQSGEAIDGIAVPGDTPAATPSGRLPTELAGGEASREAALTQNQRIEVESDLVSGSINLTGARIDDLHLLNYRETVDKDSETITFLSPSGGPRAAFIELGWQGADSLGPVPDGKTVWAAEAGARLTPETPVTLTYDNGAGLVFERRIALDDAYMFTVTDTVTNTGSSGASLTPYGRFTRVGIPETSGFWILHEGLIGVFGDEGLNEEDYSTIAEDGPKSWQDVPAGWLGITDKYWAGALIPDKAAAFDGRFIHSGSEETPIYQADFRQSALSVPAGGTAELTTRAFAGAKVVRIVDGYGEAFDIRLFDRLIDWGWFWFITKPLFYGMDFFFGLFGNFGVAILAVTVIVKAVFFPLASMSYRSMGAMRKMQPKMTEIREKYANDKAKQQQAMMELYKTEKINPLAGCWPMLIQIPVFFALYKVLFVTIEMRHAPFFGWIQDLAAPDPTSLFNLFGLIPWDPPTFLMIGVWPLIMGLTMFIQMKLNPTPPDPTQAMIFTWMPVIFTFMLASFPAGLVIYWAWNNALSVAQQYVIMRSQGVDVDLIGNIMSTFRKAPATPAVAAATASSNDNTATAEPAKPAREREEKQADPVDSDRKVKPKGGSKRRRRKS